MTGAPLYGKASLATLDKDLAFLREHDLRAEVYLPSDRLDSMSRETLDLLSGETARGISFHAPFVDLSPAGLDRKVLDVTRHRFGQVMDLAERIRPRHVIFHPGYDQWRYGSHEDIWLENSAAIWSEVTRWGQKTGIRPLLENVFDSRPDHLVRLREKVGQPLGFCLDTGHFLLFSEVVLGNWLEALGQDLAEVHMHDNHGQRDDHLPVGEGDFDFPALLSHMEALDDYPLCVLEHHSHRETLRSLANFLTLSGG